MEGVAVAGSNGRGWTVKPRAGSLLVSKAPPSASSVAVRCFLPPQAEGEPLEGETHAEGENCEQLGTQLKELSLPGCVDD